MCHMKLSYFKLISSNLDERYIFEIEKLGVIFTYNVILYSKISNNNPLDFKIQRTTQLLSSRKNTNQDNNK